MRPNAGTGFDFDAMARAIHQRNPAQDNPRYIQGTLSDPIGTRAVYWRGIWRSFEAVEYTTLIWVDWFNNHRPQKPIGNIPPIEAKASFYVAMKISEMVV